MFSKGFKTLQSKREFHLLRPGQHETSDEEEDLVLGIKPPQSGMGKDAGTSQPIGSGVQGHHWLFGYTVSWGLVWVS